ncbi:MAG: hypothetical protein PHN79_11060 [Methanoregula sp.]|nr:hypothetical protein [Methanoregula sp.]
MAQQVVGGYWSVRTVNRGLSVHPGFTPFALGFLRENEGMLMTVRSSMEPFFYDRFYQNQNQNLRFPDCTSLQDNIDTHRQNPDEIFSEPVLNVNSPEVSALKSANLKKVSHLQQIKEMLLLSHDFHK